MDVFNYVLKKSGTGQQLFKEDPLWVFFVCVCVQHLSVPGIYAFLRKFGCELNRQAAGKSLRL